MRYVSTNDLNFRATVENWLQENGEISVLIRYSHAGGNKEFEFFHSMQSFNERLQRMAPKTCVIVFREKQLPLRGKVDAHFIKIAVQTIQNAEEYLIAGLERVKYGAMSWHQFISGVGLEELKESLCECEGEIVALGAYPSWLEDNDEVVSAVVSEADGTVITGVY